MNTTEAETVRRFFHWLEGEGYVIGQYDAADGTYFPNGNNADQWVRAFAVDGSLS